LRHGDPLRSDKTPYEDILKFFQDATKYQGDECIFWPFSKKMNYPIMRTEKRSRPKCVHRLVCSKINGPPPSDRPLAIHSCGNGHLACITPSHLRWGSVYDNLADMELHGTRARGTRLGIATLTECEAQEIYQRAHSGERTSRLAAQFKITRSTVYRIKIGKLWAIATASLRAARSLP
ncbi:MAG: hypothetical protein WBD73_00895, partial [Candidatus Acidiferrales bacterium]